MTAGAQTRPKSALFVAVREAARLCGQAAFSHFGKNLAVERKTDGSEVTRADRDAERETRAWIHEHFPDDSIVGEEFGDEPRSEKRRWIIDPIDGTSSFVRGVPLWGSLVAVESGGEVIAGAIHCPATGDFLVAARGEGCWQDEQRVAVSAVDALSSATILGTDQRFRADPSRAPRWSDLAARVSIARSWGDCYGYVLVATGRAELMVDDRMSPWDVAALIPVIEEAGGVFTDWRGRRGIGPDAIASNAALAGEFRNLLGVPRTSA